MGIKTASATICGVVTLIMGAQITNGQSIYSNEAFMRMYANPATYQSQGRIITAPAAPVIQYAPRPPIPYPVPIAPQRWEPPTTLAREVIRQIRCENRRRTAVAACQRQATETLAVDVIIQGFGRGNPELQNQRFGFLLENCREDAQTAYERCIETPSIVR